MTQYSNAHRIAAKPGSKGSAGQRGIVMVISLLALVVLGIAAAAFIRSMDTSVLIAGKLGFRRDLANQSERGVVQAMTLVSSATGLLNAKTAREANLAAANYSASRLPQNKQGIPNQLIGSGNWTMTGADLQDSTTQVKVRYVIDRLCTSAGPFDSSTCSYLQTPADSNGTNQNPKPIGPRLEIYRVTVRVTDSVGTQSFFQSTFSY